MNTSERRRWSACIWHRCCPDGLAVPPSETSEHIREPMMRTAAAKFLPAASIFSVQFEISLRICKIFAIAQLKISFCAHSSVVQFRKFLYKYPPRNVAGSPNRGSNQMDYSCRNKQLWNSTFNPFAGWQWQNAKKETLHITVYLLELSVTDGLSVANDASKTDENDPKRRVLGGEG